MTAIDAIKFSLRSIWDCSKGLFLLYVGAQIFLSLSTIINMLTFKGVLDAANGVPTYLGLSIYSIIAIRLGYEIIRKVVDGVSWYWWYKLDADYVIYLNKAFIDKVASLDLSTFENPYSVGLIQRAFNRFQVQYKYYLGNIIKTLTTAIELSLSIAIFFFASPTMALILILANIIPIIAQAKLGNVSFLIYRADDETRRKFGYLSELLQIRETLPEIKLNQAFGFFKDRLIAVYQKYTTHQVKLQKRQQIIMTLVGFLPILAVFAFSIYIASDLMRQVISIGSFVFLFTNVFTFSGALSNLTQYVGNLGADSMFMNEAVEFFDFKPKITFPAITTFSKAYPAQDLQNPTINFKHVSFSYPNASHPAINDINLVIPYGQNLALVGENGAGKSTLVKLLLRMYDPTQGQILINGIDIKDIPEKLLFGCYSTLFQDFGKFYLTIRENLEFAAGRKVSNQEAEEYLKFSNAWEFVKDTRYVINQQLGPEYKEGIDLSGGQWQRLAIARAYAKKAPILILDEPTSAVDAKAEMEIFDRLNKRMRSNTLIFISHRFSTIKDAERIIVLDKGKIIEDGTHESLMTNKGKYAKLYTIQAERYLRKEINYV